MALEEVPCMLCKSDELFPQKPKTTICNHPHFSFANVDACEENQAQFLLLFSLGKLFETNCCSNQVFRKWRAQKQPWTMDTNTKLFLMSGGDILVSMDNLDASLWKISMFTCIEPRVLVIQEINLSYNECL
jgi:hypothetical protein